MSKWMLRLIVHGRNDSERIINGYEEYSETLKRITSIGMIPVNMFYDIQDGITDRYRTREGQDPVTIPIDTAVGQDFMFPPAHRLSGSFILSVIPARNRRRIELGMGELEVNPELAVGLLDELIPVLVDHSNP